MLGAIIGDIVGSRFEFNNTNNYNFALIASDSDFTDDTICSVAIADAILNGGEDYQSYLLKWCRKYPNPKGAYGGSFSTWLRSSNPQPYNSFGNGSAMRVSAVAWWFDSLDDVLWQAKLTALPTHNHPEGVKGAVAVAHAIWHFRKGGNMAGFIKLANEYYPGFMHHPYELGRFDETCQGTVPLCFYIVAHSMSFEDAIRNAVACGGDSDTIGAIVGSIAEAAWGIDDALCARALSLLPEDMCNVVNVFRNQINLRYGNI